MATLNIQAVKAVPGLATRNSAGNVAMPGSALTVWSLGGNFVDGSGSTQPVTFKTPLLPTASYSPPLTVDVLCLFPSQYAGGAFDFVASLPIGMGGNLVPVLRSSGNSVPSPLPNPAAAIPLSFHNFQFDDQLNIPGSCTVPFRWAGDFKWTMTFKNLPSINSLQTTRLEFSYARAAAPTGPNFIANQLERTRVDLKGIYPIGLIRLFFPSPPEFTQVPNFTQDYARWYAARVAKTVWAWSNPLVAPKPVYDALEGRSFFNLSALGGGFNLDLWLQANPPARCNCYDLAGIVQLGCCLLLSSAGAELMDSRWVFQEPNGFILPCVLYGWGGVWPCPPGVNNPFFLNNNPQNPYVAPPDLKKRSPFGNHAWVEVLPEPFNPGTRVVLDCTTAVLDAGGIYSPEIGTRGAVEYKAAHIDTAADPTGAVTGNLKENTRSSPYKSGDCYQNNSWYTSHNANPGLLGRVGVWNAAGANPPAFLESMITSSLPPRLASEIEILIAKGENPERPEVAFNDSSITDGVLGPIITSSWSNLVFRNEQKQVADGIAILRIIVDGASYTDTATAELCTEIQVFNSATFARAALIHALTGYQAPTVLSESFEALPTPLGQTSLIHVSGTSLHLVRGNHYIQLTLNPKTLEAPSSSLEPLAPIAERLDAYLSSRTLPPGQERKPELSLAAPEASSFNVGDVITLSAHGDDFAHVDGASSNGAAVICAGRTGEAQHVEFFVVGTGEAELSLHVAHKETLLPATESWAVTIV